MDCLRGSVMVRPDMTASNFPLLRPGSSPDNWPSTNSASMPSLSAISVPTSMSNPVSLPLSEKVMGRNVPLVAMVNFSLAVESAAALVLAEQPVADRANAANAATRAALLLGENMRCVPLSVISVPVMMA